MKKETIIDLSIRSLESYFHEENFEPFLEKIQELYSTSFVYLEEITGNNNYAAMMAEKICNILIGKYQYKYRHEFLIAKPFGLIVDPSNSCPLKCPGCLHDSNSRKNNPVSWPLGMLQEDTYQQLLQQFGSYALYIHFFNWGEPLLNKNTPRFVEMAKEYMLYTVISSNLSVKFNAEQLVLSGLDYLTLSIDGATAETYRQYRRGGDFSLVMDNLEKLVEAKQKFNSKTPSISWQYLVFKHNIADIPLARKMAADFGIDEIHFAEPYDVSWADPAIVAAENPPLERILLEMPTGRKDLGQMKLLENVARVHPPNRQNWGLDIVKEKKELFRGRKGNTCQWLYKNLVSDAHGRFFPCCYAPEKNDKYQYVFSSVDKNNIESHFNSEPFRSARTELLEQGKNVENRSGKPPYCIACNSHIKEVPNINNDMIGRYFNKYYLGSSGWGPFLNDDSVLSLQDWGGRFVSLKIKGVGVRSVNLMVLAPGILATE